MFTDFSELVEIYTPASGVVSGVAPAITSVSSSLTSPSDNNPLSGTQLNGLSENNAYGDDYQGDTDYPLVRLVQVAAPNNVYFATTHNETTHSIAPGTAASTQFDLPTGMAAGSYNLYVVTNGIESSPVSVSVTAGPDFSLTANPASVSVAQGSSGTSQITVVPVNGFNDSVTLTTSGLPSGVSAQFNPNPATTTSTLTLTAAANATRGTSSVTITGTTSDLTNTTTVQLTVTAPSGPIVSLSPASLAFANTVVGATSAAKIITLTNTGNATLNITSIVPSGDFSLTTSTKPCGSTLAAGQNCRIEVTFTPTQVGARTGTLTLTNNAANSPQSVPLSGTGTGQATLTPATKTFPATTVGKSSAAKVFTLANKQSVALTGISSETTGDYSVSATTCSSSLAAKSKCTISVIFTPTQTGTRTGTLQVNDSAVNSPQTSTLTGTGK
jgi:hypothetical protein